LKMTYPPCNTLLSPSSSTGSNKSIDMDQYLLLTIQSASLLLDTETFGKMDPYVMVTYFDGKSPTILGRTPTEWNAGINPIFHYPCRPKFCVAGSNCQNDNIQFQVYEDDHIGFNTLCGSTCLTMSNILNILEEDDDNGPKEMKLSLNHLTRHNEVGTIIIMAQRVLSTKDCWGENLIPTLVDPMLFESPVERLDVSGGTAPFFKLIRKFNSPQDIRSKTHYIGKDLSRSTNELKFYEQVKKAKQLSRYTNTMNNKEQTKETGELVSYILDYGGLLKITERTTNQEVELLVLKNLHDNMSCLRLLDLKLGQKTACANWFGKSRSHAMKQTLLEGWTISYKEGYRLEGFEGMPISLHSRDPLVDFRHSKKESQDTKLKSKLEKKARRLMLQCLSGQDILLHFLAIQDKQNTPSMKGKMSSVEYTELIFHEIVKRISRLSVICRNQPVPQKWIGSSFALGYDCLHLPLVPQTNVEESSIRSHVICTLFDWGKSEWNTLEQEATRSHEDHNDQAQYWKYYTGGVDRLAYEVAYLYHHRFCNTTRWEKVEITLMDFDSPSINDFIGRVVIPIKKTTKKTVKLSRNKNSREVTLSKSSKSLRKSIYLTYSLQYVEYTCESDIFKFSHKALKSQYSYPKKTWHRRLKGSWKFTIHEAENLPSIDPKLNPSGRPKNDPYCVIIVMSSKTEGRSFRQLTSTKQNVANPRWDETFDFPLASTDTALADALMYAGGSILVDGVAEQEDRYRGIRRGGYLDSMFGGTKACKVGTDGICASLERACLSDNVYLSPNEDSTYYQEWKKRLGACSIQDL